jgi:lipopolysaccharide transport system permease protein
VRETFLGSAFPVRLDGVAAVQAAQRGIALPNSAPAAVEVVVIQPRRAWQLVDWRALWRSRELLAILAYRDISVRYKQTVLGATWAVLQPLLQLVAFWLFFGRMGGLAGTVEGDYSLFLLAGLLPWQLFATGVGQGAQSVVSNSNLIRKVYFPRLVVPLAALGSACVDFAVAAVVALPWLVFRGLGWHASQGLVPVFALGVVLVTIAIGVGVSALVAEFRDFRYITGFLLQVWMFFSPVAYPLSIVPARWQLLYAVNPLVGLIEGFRAALLGQPLAWGPIAVSVLSLVVLLVAGLACFRRAELRLADIV